MGNYIKIVKDGQTLSEKEFHYPITAPALYEYAEESGITDPEAYIVVGDTQTDKLVEPLAKPLQEFLGHHYTITATLTIGEVSAFARVLEVARLNLCGDGEQPLALQAIKKMEEALKHLQKLPRQDSGEE